MIPYDPKEILGLVYDSDVKLTARQYIRAVADHLSIPLKAAQKIVNRLIRDQELCYIDLYGASCIVKNYLRPVQLTPHFLVKPPQMHSDADILAININPGISFGSGDHPTTRLCLEAVDMCIFEQDRFENIAKNKCADIGTGSGVLAVAMILAGFSGCRAYEIDPVSVNEAKKNVLENHLGSQIDVIDDYFTTKPETYAMICANLRYPTLMQLSTGIYESLCPGGIAVLSGFREWEKDKLLPKCLTDGFKQIWQKDEKKWSAAALLKKY